MAYRRPDPEGVIHSNRHFPLEEWDIELEVPGGLHIVTTFDALITRKRNFVVGVQPPLPRPASASRCIVFNGNQFQEFEHFPEPNVGCLAGATHFESSLR